MIIEHNFQFFSKISKNLRNPVYRFSRFRALFLRIRLNKHKLSPHQSSLFSFGDLSNSSAFLISQILLKLKAFICSPVRL